MPRCFNPRTHMGCDRYVPPGIRQRNGFNPRTHMGCDRIWRVPRQGVRVSIHAPTWGATGQYQAVRRGTGVSIHAPTWGATGVSSFIVSSILLFQSTHPHGVRRNAGIRKTYRVDVSIHAPTWGATEFGGQIPHYVCGFNPRTHMGCDL